MISARQSLLNQMELLRKEYESDKAEFSRQTEIVGIRRKVKRGDAWLPIRVGRSYYNSLNQMSLEIFRIEDSDVEHNFEYGRPVRFFRLVEQNEGGNTEDERKPKLSYFNVTANVGYVDGERMVVTLTDNALIVDLQQCADPIGVQLFFDETSYRLMFDALQRTLDAATGRLAYLRDLFYSKAPAQKLSFADLSLPWLNKTQEHAVNEVLRAKDVAVVHGPPGTGKTTTLVEAINETLRRESQVMVCAQSNMAVDWISERLVDRGVNVLRIGNPSRVDDKMLSFTYEHRFADHPDYPLLWKIRKTIREMRQQRHKTPSVSQKLNRLKSRAIELELRINADIFGEARVIASTLVGSASHVLDGMKFSTLFIDEAAQALEAACWIPMRRVGRVVLAGDHCQLPPTVKCYEAMKGGLGVTLMERIVENKPDVVTLLSVQYRMNREIMQFSSDYFYEGKVVSHPSVEHRSILDLDHPMQWIDTSELDGKEEFVGETYGRINKAEAELTLATILDYTKKIGKQRILDEQIDFGIISPYRAQVQYLRKQIRKLQDLKPFRHLISVNTVDGFQGQERDVIIISLVRANDEGQIGFLSDLRRMNVAITRARMKLVIMGSVATMSHHQFYRKLWNYVSSLSSL